MKIMNVISFFFLIVMFGMVIFGIIHPTEPALKRTDLKPLIERIAICENKYETVLSNYTALKNTFNQAFSQLKK